MHPPSAAGTHTWFHTTPWTLIEQLSASAAERDGALDGLVRIYWGAVYSYLRRQGHSVDVAAELAEGFFVHVVLSRELFKRADRAKGRLRALMLASLRNYLADVRRSESRQSKASLRALNLEAEERLAAQAAGSDPAQAFDRRWALAAVEEAARRCENHFMSAGRAGHWRVFEARVMAPAVRATNPPPLDALANQHGFATSANAAAAVQTVKKRFEAILREVVAETVHGEDDAVSEFDDVMKALG